MLGQMQTSGGMLRVGVGGGIEIFTNYLLIPPNIYTDKFLLKVEISTFGVPKERIAYSCFPVFMSSRSFYRLCLYPL